MVIKENVDLYIEKRYSNEVLITYLKDANFWDFDTIVKNATLKIEDGMIVVEGDLQEYEYFRGHHKGMFVQLRGPRRYWKRKEDLLEELKKDNLDDAEKRIKNYRRWYHFSDRYSIPSGLYSTAILKKCSIGFNSIPVKFMFKEDIEDDID